MRIEINKDILNDYKDEIWKGFTLRELISLMAGGACALLVVFVLNRWIGMYPATAIYLAVPAALPAVALGFYRYQGYLRPLDLIKELIFMHGCGQLTLQHEAGTEHTPVFTMERQGSWRKRRRRNQRLKGKKTRKKGRT
jgi:hypothetical protein